MLGKVFKAYDVRATYPKPLNDRIAWQIGYATGRFLTEVASDAGYDDPMMRHIVVGRDMRKSGPALTDAVKQGVKDFGAHVIDIGMVDTPMVYFAINYLSCAGGVQTTASHNPADYNGFKISKIFAKPVGMTTGLDDIRRFAAMANHEKVVPQNGREEARDLWDAYAQHVLRFVDPDLMEGKKKLHVVIDASNGMAGTMVPKIFNQVKGLKITAINFDNKSGEFVHEPNPLVEANLETLKDKLRSVKGDIGICFDGDADRLVVVDENGEMVGCDLLTAWLAKGFLQENPGSAIVYDLRSSRILPELVKKGGGKPVKCRVGHVFMKEKLAVHKAVFGGELSGHFYFRDNFNADSGAIAFASVISRLVHAKGTMSEEIKPLKKYIQSGEINFQNEDKEGAIADLKEAFPKAKIEELDGVSVDAGDWWCNVRLSNTEPLLRLNMEAKNQSVLDAALEDVAEFLGDRVKH